MHTAPTIEQAIVELAVARAAALSKRDVSALRVLLAPDFVYTNASGATFNKEEYLLAYAIDPSVVWRSQQLSEVIVHIFGSTAVLTAIVSDQAQFGDHHLDADFRTTQVYVKRDADWQYVAGHTSNFDSPP